jgi:succinate dehydrogenase / fumarate reductase cytochrome b subunit
MSAASIPLPIARAARFYESTLGKKIVMAITGVIGFGFVIAHLLGNLQFYLGPEALNHYGAKLRELGPILYVARGVLLLALVLHVIAAFQLWSRNRQARPVRYSKWTASSSSFASRTMWMTGPLLFVFIAYHLAHLTFGSPGIHPDYRELPTGNPDVYHNVVAGFSQPLAAGLYIFAMAFLGFHLVHGVYSMFLSVGLNHPKYSPMLRNFATAATAFIFLGNISIPISVLLGFYQK